MNVRADEDPFAAGCRRYVETSVADTIPVQVLRRIFHQPKSKLVNWK